ncbi:MAG TPA: response regulator, partial [Burkholderiaceae bacterium]|nr:response regulator [Burkholderiaceae bacterium]
MVLIEDEAVDAEIVAQALHRAGFACTCRRVDTEEHLRQELGQRLPDVILSDFSMPRFNGIDALHLAHQLCPDVPFIFVSGTIGEHNAIKALKGGATDYVLKHDLGRLAPAVRRSLEDAKALAEQRRMQAALRHSEL